MFTLPSKALSLKELYLSIVPYYKDTFDKVWRIVLINMLIVGIFQVIINSKVPTAATTAQLTESQKIFMGSLNIITFFIMTYFFTVVLHRIYTIGKGKNITVKESCLIVLHKYIPIAVTSVIVFLVVLVGFMLLVIPGIFLFVLLAFAVPFVLLENKKVFGSIKASILLVWGRWWKAFAILFPVVIALFFLSFIAQFFGGKSFLVYILLNTIFFTLFYPFMPVVISLLFNDLNLSKTNPENLPV